MDERFSDKTEFSALNGSKYIIGDCWVLRLEEPDYQKIFTLDCSLICLISNLFGQVKADKYSSRACFQSSSPKTPSYDQDEAANSLVRAL